MGLLQTQLCKSDVTGKCGPRWRPAVPLRGRLRRGRALPPPRAMPCLERRCGSRRALAWGWGVSGRTWIKFTHVWSCTCSPPPGSAHTCTRVWNVYVHPFTHAHNIHTHTLTLLLPGTLRLKGGPRTFGAGVRSRSASPECPFLARQSPFTL